MSEPNPDLQFDKAEYKEPPPPSDACVNCSQSAAPQYYLLGDRRVCGPCAGLLEKIGQAPTRGQFWTAALWGMGAAVVGAVGLMIVTAVSGYQLGLLSILVGWLVGRAMNQATGARGSRGLQLLALAISYVGITASYAPVFIEGLKKSAERPEDAHLNLTVVVPLIAALCLAAPFLELSSGISGILGIAIVAFGLHQAWKMTGRKDLPITGPHGEAVPEEASTA